MHSVKRYCSSGRGSESGIHRSVIRMGPKRGPTENGRDRKGDRHVLARSVPVHEDPEIRLRNVRAQQLDHPASMLQQARLGLDLSPLPAFEQRSKKGQSRSRASLTSSLRSNSPCRSNAFTRTRRSLICNISPRFLSVEPVVSPFREDFFLEATNPFPDDSLGVNSRPGYTVFWPHHGLPIAQ